jgi:hypothetical protein
MAWKHFASVEKTAWSICSSNNVLVSAYFSDTIWTAEDMKDRLRDKNNEQGYQVDKNLERHLIFFNLLLDYSR